ncbi:uncharacterized protein F4822DRAFT_342018 [Hypoxylon trugodes]|uniref:uncharacterized protein n=1 Tax=Hypoxylon trugodes TaxID=326681 RepID=UPI00219AB739|nr:uncharacterized protein F4822DRAFT_342018 [Hypoxylon trugodes]KAI1385350.1 hypothetical protein F4822DRAFT_342018 [Hypoxylon trugodes]
MSAPAPGAPTRRASSVSTTELARQRDLNKYYQPWLDSKRLKGVPADTGPDENRPVTCSHDTTLTALAQLATLRLNVKRGMVSLIDANTQIILAEATQTLSLVDERRHASGDHIWLGNVSLPRRDCMDEHTFGSINTWKDADGSDIDIPSFIVKDTLKDDRFKYRAYVTSGASVRFYAGVPIITKQGHAIGVYAVSDIRPRPQGLTLDEAQFMEDVAQIVADHLERVMDTVGRVSERDFMRGISYFLEDLSEYKYQLSNTDRSVQAPSTKQAPDVQATDPRSEPLRGRSSQPGSTSLSGSSSPSPVRDSSANDETDTRKVPRFSRDSDSRAKEQPDSSSDNIRRIFTQASQLLCQQARATGCIFTDAASGLFSGQSESVISPPTSTDPAAAMDVNFESTEDEETESEKAGKDPAPSPGYGSNLPQASFGDRLDEMADVLSISMADGDGDEYRHGVIKRKNLKKFILRYPFGKCFYLNKGRIVSDQSLILDEVIVGGGGNHSLLNASVEDVEDQPHMLLPRELLTCLSEAKWLIFLPLFNYAQGQWFASGFIWGDDFKMGDPDDALPYFKTFGSCMMSEVASMEVLNTNIAKSTFIASISHDLRSPLHGMLGSLEFLEDTMTSAYQTSLIGAIETCGKTLLDTIDHLLDYAKINNLNRASSYLSSSGEKKTWRDTRDVAEPLSTTFNLAILLEEVVEAVFAGQTFRKINLRHHDPVDDATAQIKSIGIDDSTTTEEQIHTGSVKFSGKVFLILHIQKLASWCLQGSQTGGLRRVIMNVVGNAIKYCKTGCIDVSLKAEPTTSSDVNVEFSVKDTGIGMSQNFLANHLFKAFSQEDSFTPGTGLGLSITSQIVRNMDGKIKVDSEKGVGTHVNIMIPMKIAAPGSSGGPQEDVLREAMKITAGKKICILDPLLSNDGTGAELSKLESSIATFCQEWFDMTVIESETIDADSDTAIYIYAEPPPIEHLVRQHLDRKEMAGSGKEAALLIICTNAFEAAALRAAGIKELVSLGRIIEVISQPVGVRKLGKVLLQCLQRVESSGQNMKRGLFSKTPSPSLSSNQAIGYFPQSGWNSSAVVYDQTESRYRPSIEALKWKSEQPRLNIPVDTSLTRPLPLSRISGQSSLNAAVLSQHIRARSGDTTKKPPRVLLVDDNAINLKLLVTFMTKIKLPYAEATNGLEAVNKYKGASDRPFDFVLMDLQMPVMDGLEATRQIREFEQQLLQEKAALAEEQGEEHEHEEGFFKPSTIIAITGVGNEATRQEAMEAGMSQFLTKPVKFKALQQLLLEESK